MCLKQKRYTIIAILTSKYQYQPLHLVANTAKVSDTTIYLGFAQRKVCKDLDEHSLKSVKQNYNPL
jgi:hypothetical protein